jgi:lysophospholipase L1-like esterase
MVSKVKIHRFARGGVVIALLSLFLSSCSSGPSGPTEDLTEIVIDAFGNSITEGFGDTRKPPGYPFQLEQLLKPTHPNAIVVNRGVGGERTAEGVRRLGAVLDKDGPDYVLILEGINDVNTQIPSTTIVENLGKMVRMVKARGSVPLIGTLLPATRAGYSSTRIRTVNIMIRDLADREKIQLVDFHATFMEEDDFTLLLDDDGLHPNSLGYNLIAEEWYEGLLAIL